MNKQGVTPGTDGSWCMMPGSELITWQVCWSLVLQSPLFFLQE